MAGYPHNLGMQAWQRAHILVVDGGGVRLAAVAAAAAAAGVQVASARCRHITSSSRAADFGHLLRPYRHPIGGYLFERDIRLMGGASAYPTWEACMCEA